MSQALRRFIFCFLLCACLWLGGLFWFIAQIPEQLSADDTPTDAIVALTGGSNRLEYALQLLTQGKGRKLFISGVHDTTSADSLLRHAPAGIRAQLATLPDGSIILGHEAENTIGNAEETSRWLAKEGYRSIRLVTANYHMPRSLEEFTQTLPGVTIVPEPVVPDDFQLNSWWLHNESRTLVLLEYHKFLASKLRHWLLSVTRTV